MTDSNEALGEMLTQMLPNIINDSKQGPFISMSQMLDIVVKRNSFRGVYYDKSSLFPDELITHLHARGQEVENAHRITLILGNRSSLTLHILAEAPGSEAFVRYKLVYTDGSRIAESKIGYGSRALTAERFDDLDATFERHRPLLTGRLDELALSLSRRQLERQLVEQALPIFTAGVMGQYDYPYTLDLNARDLPEGARLDLHLDKHHLISFRLTMDRFEAQLAALGEVIATIDTDVVILTAGELERHQLRVADLRNMLPSSDKEKVTFAHFVHRSKELLEETLGAGCFIIIYLTGLSAELYLAMTDNLWLKAEIRKVTYRNDIDRAIERRTEIMRLMTRTELTFSMGTNKG